LEDAVTNNPEVLKVRDWYYDKKDWTHVVVKPVRICDKAWVGLNVIILTGAEIGEGVVVAAGSVVTKSVQPWTIVAGNPARVIREIPADVTFSERNDGS
jgi:acetyltransferase-like isoleucine patch superfamily enzyme